MRFCSHQSRLQCIDRASRDSYIALTISSDFTQSGSCCLALPRDIHLTLNGYVKDQTSSRKSRQNSATMASRLVLVLGDLFIPDRAIVTCKQPPAQCEAAG